MIIQRNVIQTFVFIFIPLFIMASNIETALATDHGENGWCCRGGELFQSSRGECERGRGHFYGTRGEAVRACEPENREPEGWCYDGREVFRTVREDCKRRRGRYFKSEREAHHYRETQRKGWCCKDGKVFQATLPVCERKRGHFSMEENEAQVVCNEQRVGWCCNKGELYDAQYHDCLNDGGQFIENKVEALKQCRKIPQINSLEPEIFIKGEPLTLIVRGERLHDEMILDFGPNIIVHSIKVDRLKKMAKIEIFVEPMAEEAERDVLLIHGDYRKIINRIIVKAPSQPGVDFKEKKVADMEKPSKQRSQKIKGAKLKKKQPVMLLTGAGGSNNADLVVSVKTTNEIYKGDGKTIYAEVWNNSNVAAQNFVVGFCLFSKIDSKNQSKWVGKKMIQFLGQNNQMLIEIPLQTQVSVGFKEKFIVVVDIDNKVDEGEIGEGNNQTKSFKYETVLLTAIPVFGKPIQGLQISFPCYQCKNGVSGQPYKIVFGPTASLMSDPKALAIMSDYARILLLKADGSKSLTIAENAWFSKNYITNSWVWLIPSTISPGKYTIYIESADGHYFAKSVPFKISVPISIGVQKKPETVLGEPIMQDIKGKLYKKGQLPPGAKALSVNFSIKSSKPFLDSSGMLHQIVLYVDIDANQPFTFGEPKGAKASWLTLKPVGEVKVNLFLGKKCIYGTNTYIALDKFQKKFSTWDSGTTAKTNLILDYPKKVFPKGKSTAMFTLKPKPVPVVEIWEGKIWVDNGKTSAIYNFKKYPNYYASIYFNKWDPNVDNYTNFRWVRSENGIMTGFTNELKTGEKEIKAGAKINKNILIQPSCGN
jgi:hypothetical protein